MQWLIGNARLRGFKQMKRTQKPYFCSLVVGENFCFNIDTSDLRDDPFQPNSVCPFHEKYFENSFSMFEYFQREMMMVKLEKILVN